MKIKTFKDFYNIGDLIEDEHGRAGVVISVTRNKLIVKLEYGTSTYTEASDIISFIKEIPVLMSIGALIKRATNTAI